MGRAFLILFLVLGGLLMLPVLIGLGGAAIGILAGLFGAAVGILAAAFGILIAIPAAIFDFFTHNDHVHLVGLNATQFLLLVLLFVAVFMAFRKRKATK